MNRIGEIVKSKLKDYSLYFLLFVSFALVLSLGRNILKIRKAYKQIGEAQEKVDKLKLENEELGERLEEEKSEQNIEKQIRDKLGLAKEEETIIVLPDDELLKKLAPRLGDEEETLPDPNWKKWLKLFF